MSAPDASRGGGPGGPRVEAGRAPERGRNAPDARREEPAAEVRGLVVQYPGGVRALRSVSLQVAPGECLAVVGESGCGKTTLGRALLGLLPEGTRVWGQARVAGRDVVRMGREARQRVLGKDAGIVFQDPMTRLDPLLRIGEHFAELYAAHGQGLRKDEAEARAAKALAEVGVPASRLRSYPHEVSGGQRQRVMIALALALGPRLLVADEPTTSLDVIVEAQITELLRRLLTLRRMGLLLITHNLGLVARIADRVAVVYAGQVVELADVGRAFAAPAHPYTQGLLASVIHPGTTQLRSIPGRPPDLARPPPACSFHPRCPRARQLCAARAPPMARVAGSAEALCWFPGPPEAVEPQAERESWGPPLPHAREVLD